MNSFDEYSEKAKQIMNHVEWLVNWMKIIYGVTVKAPGHDVARRFLNEIEEFEAAKEE